MIALQLITPPATEPLTLADAKAHLYVVHDAQDDAISEMIKSAREALDGKDGILGRALMPQTWELVMDAFPRLRIRVPLPPLQSVTSVSYYDTAGALQVLSGAAYVVETAAEPGIIEPVDSWPSTMARAGAVRIRFVAGYADAAAVPRRLLSAMRLDIADMFENRQTGILGTISENPAYERLTFPFRSQLLA